MSELLQAGQHPDADQLNAFVEHTLPAHEQQQTLAHLAVCPACRQIVALSLPPAGRVSRCWSPKLFAIAGSPAGIPHGQGFPRSLPSSSWSCLFVMSKGPLLIHPHYPRWPMPVNRRHRPQRKSLRQNPSAAWRSWPRVRHSRGQLRRQPSQCHSPKQDRGQPAALQAASSAELELQQAPLSNHPCPASPLGHRRAPVDR